jgi:branched-chain amino acid transport system substrate-binding protein
MCCMNPRTVILLFLFFFGTGIAYAAQPIRIGVSIALSGRHAPMGEMYAKGLRLWEKDVNDRGGLLGRPVKLLIYDDHSSPDDAKAIYQRMLTQERVDFVMGPYSSSISQAIAPIVEQYRYPTLLPLAAAHSIWDDRPKYVFGMHTLGRRWTSATFAYLALQEIKRVGILVNERLFHMGDPKDTDKWARRLDISIPMKEMLDPKRLQEQIQRARDLDVQALLVWGYMDDAVMVRKSLDKVGWYPKVYFSHIAPSLEKYHGMLGPLANLTVGTSVWEPTSAGIYPGGKQFLDAFTRKHGILPSYHAAMGYAAGEVLAQAISQAGTTDREAVREKLVEMDMITIVGRYGLDARGMQVRHRPLIIQWQEGKKKVLWPKSMSNAELQVEPEERP